MAKVTVGEVDAMALVDRIEESFRTNQFLSIRAVGDYSDRAHRYAAMVAVHSLIEALDDSGNQVPG